MAVVISAVKKKMACNTQETEEEIFLTGELNSLPAMVAMTHVLNRKHSDSYTQLHYLIYPLNILFWPRNNFTRNQL